MTNDGTRSKLEENTIQDESFHYSSEAVESYKKHAKYFKERDAIMAEDKRDEQEEEVYENYAKV